jgi:hypothetical protein
VWDENANLPLPQASIWDDFMGLSVSETWEWEDVGAGDCGCPSAIGKGMGVNAKQTGWTEYSGLNLPKSILLILSTSYP